MASVNCGWAMVVKRRVGSCVKGSISTSLPEAVTEAAAAAAAAHAAAVAATAPVALLALEDAAPAAEVAAGVQPANDGQPGPQGFDLEY